MVLISNMKIFISNSSPKIPNKVFLVPNLDINISSRNFAIDNFEAADFKYDNSFLKF